jgi:hypothetical protein
MLPEKFFMKVRLFSILPGLAPRIPIYPVGVREGVVEVEVNE